MKILLKCYADIDYLLKGETYECFLPTSDYKQVYMQRFPQRDCGVAMRSGFIKDLIKDKILEIVR